MLKPFLVFQSLILVNIPFLSVPSRDFCATSLWKNATDDVFVVKVHRVRLPTAVSFWGHMIYSIGLVSIFDDVCVSETTDSVGHCFNDLTPI